MAIFIIVTADPYLRHTGILLGRHAVNISALMCDLWVSFEKAGVTLLSTNLIIRRITRCRNRDRA